MGEMVFTNNVLAQPICFNCVKKKLKYDSLVDANRFCRTYNIQFDPNLWIKMASTLKEETFKEYMSAQYGEKATQDYVGSTDDV
jgi:hypothetical protein